MVSTNYKNAFTEVYTILEYLDEEDYVKIPQEVIKTIEINMNAEYYYEIDVDKDLREQPMLEETKAILFNLFRDYLSTPEQKEKIIRMQKEERQRNEEKKKQQYDSSKIFENRTNRVKDEELTTDNKETSLLVVEESIFKRILNILKNIFKMKN